MDRNHPQRRTAEPVEQEEAQKKATADFQEREKRSPKKLPQNLKQK